MKNVSSRASPNVASEVGTHQRVAFGEEAVSHSLRDADLGGTYFLPTSVYILPIGH